MQIYNNQASSSPAYNRVNRLPETRSVFSVQLAPAPADVYFGAMSVKDIFHRRSPSPPKGPQGNLARSHEVAEDSRGAGSSGVYKAAAVRDEARAEGDRIQKSNDRKIKNRGYAQKNRNDLKELFEQYGIDKHSIALEPTLEEQAIFKLGTKPENRTAYNKAKAAVDRRRNDKAKDELERVSGKSLRQLMEERGHTARTKNIKDLTPSGLRKRAQITTDSAEREKLYALAREKDLSKSSGIIRGRKHTQAAVNRKSRQNSLEEESVASIPYLAPEQLEPSSRSPLSYPATMEQWQVTSASSVEAPSLSALQGQPNTGLGAPWTGTAPASQASSGRKFNMGDMVDMLNPAHNLVSGNSGRTPAWASGSQVSLVEGHVEASSSVQPSSLEVRSPSSFEHQQLSAESPSWRPHSPNLSGEVVAEFHRRNNGRDPRTPEFINLFNERTYGVSPRLSDFRQLERPLTPVSGNGDPIYTQTQHRYVLNSDNRRGGHLYTGFNPDTSRPEFYARTGRQDPTDNRFVIMEPYDQSEHIIRPEGSSSGKRGKRESYQMPVPKKSKQ